MQKTEKATFAAGCFWGVEDSFSKIPGVIATRVGYTGGKKEFKEPSYQLVCTGKTEHAEAVEVIFEPNKVSFEQLLDAFWKMHDLATRNRQGPDVGSQYRSAIFYHSEAQREAALASLRREQQRIGKKIATEIVAAGKFYEAEEYHQKYAQKHGGAACHL